MVLGKRKQCKTMTFPLETLKLGIMVLEWDYERGFVEQKIQKTLKCTFCGRFMTIKGPRAGHPRICRWIGPKYGSRRTCVGRIEPPLYPRQKSEAEVA